MSLVVATWVPEGIVMASDSRQSVAIGGKGPDGKEFKVETVNSDSVTKTFLLQSQQVGVSHFGQDLLGGIPMAGHIKRFSEEKLKESDDVESIVQKLVEFMNGEFGAADTGFHVAGYKKEGRASMPHVYYCHSGKKLIERRNKKADGGISYGSTWSGQADVIGNLLSPVIATSASGQQTILRPSVPIVWDAMPLQDAIDFSVFAIRTTIDTIRFQARPKNVGGAIDVLAITPVSCSWIVHKELRANGAM